MIDAGLLDYFAARQAQGAQARQSLLAMMTKRERSLVREAAVMAYVQGSLLASRDTPIPPDSDILANVLDGCIAMSDLYPVMRRLYRRGRRTVADPVGGGQDTP